MAQQITRWRPDTCDCVICMGWDDKVEAKDRTFETTEVEHKCVAHRNIPDEQLLAELTNENQQKNLVIGKAMEVMGMDVKTAIEEGAIGFAFDAQRKLEVTVRGMDANKKAELDAALEADPAIDTRKGGVSRLKSVEAKEL